MLYKVEEGYHSINLDKLNNVVAKADIAVVTNLSTEGNRAIVIHKGTLVDAFNVVTGAMEGSQNFSKSLTHLGIYTVHAVEYCPPWFANDKKIDPCTTRNRLGG